jgi:mRNA-degrading endonuclease toxin of MazEF toxin-antitoxin module
VLLPAGTAGNLEDSIVMPEQVRTVARSRVTGRPGSLRDPDLRTAVEARLLDHPGIGLSGEAE